MKNLRHNLARLSRQQKLVVGAMLVIVLFTWLAACAVLASLF